MKATFLDVEKALRVHQSLIEHYGGTAGIRDVGLLQSALAMPQASFGGKLLHEDLFEMAAAYMYHIIQNHPFLDGNKRTGAAVAIIFLEINDIVLEPDNDALADLAIGVSQGKTNKGAIAEFFRALAIRQ